MMVLEGAKGRVAIFKSPSQRRLCPTVAMYISKLKQIWGVFFARTLIMVLVLFIFRGRVRVQSQRALFKRPGWVKVLQVIQLSYAMRLQASNSGENGHDSLLWLGNSRSDHFKSRWGKSAVQMTLSFRIG